MSVNSNVTTDNSIIIYSGTGAPTLALYGPALYIRTDGSSSSTRMYITLDGTTWVACTTAS